MNYVWSSFSTHIYQYLHNVTASQGWGLVTLGLLTFTPGKYSPRRNARAAYLLLLHISSVWRCRFLCDQNCISRLEAPSRIHLQRDTILTSSMQLCTTFILMLAWAVGCAVADDNTAMLWNQAVHYHRWSLMSSREVLDVRCHQMEAASTNMELHNTGFHGEITYTVDLPQGVACDTCNFTVLQLLPAGLFADPYELQNLVTTTMQRGNSKLLASFKVFGVVDVEKIETDCSQTLLSVSAYYAAFQKQVGSCDAHTQIGLTVPLHARYPAPQMLDAFGLSTFVWSGLHHYNITKPLFRVDYPSKSAASPQCYSTPAQHTSQNSQQSLHWTVPAGGMWHMQLVEIITVLTAVCSLCVLLNAILAQKRM